MMSINRGFLKVLLLLLTVSYNFIYSQILMLCWYNQSYASHPIVIKKTCKDFEITRTICSNSEKSEQFLVHNRTLLGFRNMQVKLEKLYCCAHLIKGNGPVALHLLDMIRPSSLLPFFQISCILSAIKNED